MDVFKLLAIAAGFLTIGAAALLAFRPSTIAWQHVVVFSLGAVLAGISGIQLQGGAANWSVNIGQLAQAAQQSSAATTQQADALDALGKRIDQLQLAVASLESVKTAAGTSGMTPTRQRAIERLCRIVLDARRGSR